MELNANCPYCGQTITRQQLEAIRTRIRREEQEKVKAAEAVTQRRLEDQYRRLLEAERQGMKKERDEELLKSQAHFTREREVLQRKVKDLERQIEKKTSQELGDGQETDLFEILKQEFPSDLVHRVPRGQLGADIIQDVRHNGESCGLIAFDSKNHRGWQNSFVTKLKQDKARVGAVHAVVVSTAFPSGEKGLCVVDGVIVVHPKQAVYIAQLLRVSMVTLHRQNLSMKERTSKTTVLYTYISSSEFTERLQEVETLVDDARTLDTRERDAHEKTWKARDRVLTRMKAATAEIDQRVTAILERKEPTTHEPAG